MPNEFPMSPEQQAIFDAADCSCEHAPRHSTSCAKWRAVLEPGLFDPRTATPLEWRAENNRRMAKWQGESDGRS